MTSCLGILWRSLPSLGYPRLPEVARGCPTKGSPGGLGLPEGKSADLRGSALGARLRRFYPTLPDHDEARAEARASRCPTLPDCCPTLQEHVPRKPLTNFKKQRDIMDPNFLRPKTADQLEKQRDNMETFRNLLKNSGTG